MTLRNPDKKAIARSRQIIQNLRRHPMVEVVGCLDISRQKRIYVPNENGTLRRVVVSPPPYLDWDSCNPINEKEKLNSEPGLMPDRHAATAEWGAFVANLVAQGVKVIIIKPKPHLLEFTYTRDAAFVVDRQIFIGSMHAQVRKPEIKCYVNGGVVPPANQNITIEGGNVVLGKDCVFVGVGDRTTIEGANWLQEQLGTSREVIPLQLKKGILHLDCVFGPHYPKNPHSSHLIFDPKAFEKDGKISKKTITGAKYYPSKPLSNIGLPGTLRMHGKLIPLKRGERGMLVPNMVAINPELAIANYLPDRIKGVIGRFMKVIVLPFGELAKGDGSYRCATMPLLRE
jgi:N-dimethylarginine dimethylaminohydrolase